MNNFNYIIYKNIRETNILVIIKIIYKSYADVRIRSPVAWVLGKYAMHCDTMLVWSIELIAI